MIVLPSAKYFSSVPSVAEIARFTTPKSSGTFGALNTAYVYTTTGYVAVKWWDGVTTVYGNGIPISIQYITKLVAAPYNTSAEKEFSMYACDSTGKIIGHITTIGFGNYTRSQINFVDIYSLSQLGIFACDSGSGLTSYKHNGRIGTLALTNTGLTSLDLSNGFRLIELNLAYSTVLASITGVSSLRNILNFDCRITSVTSLEFSAANNPYLYNINVSNCASLTSLRAVGCILYSDYYSTYSLFKGGASLQSCGLGTAAIEQFFTDLGNGDGYINITCASGVPVNDSIATNKGYTVIGNTPC